MTNKIVGDIITYNVILTGGAPSGTNYDIVLYKVLSTGIRTDLKIITNNPVNTPIQQFQYTTISEDVPSIDAKIDLSYICPIDGLKKLSTFGNTFIVSNVPILTNLILNPTFIIGTTPDKWTKSQSGTKAIFKYPEIPGKDGTGACVSIEYQTLESGKYGRWYQSVNIDPTKIYTISGYMKTDNIIVQSGQVGGSTIQIDLYNGSTFIGTKTVISNVIGTTDWTKYQISSIIPPSNSTKAYLRLILKNCTGKAWFDDIFLGY